METVHITHEVPKDLAEGAKKFIKIIETLAPEMKDGLDFGDAPQVLKVAPEIWTMVDCFVKAAPQIKVDPMGAAVVLASMLDHAVDRLKEQELI